MTDGTSSRTSVARNAGSVACTSPCSASSGLTLRMLCTSVSYVICRASYHVMFGSRLHVHVMLCHPEPVFLQHFTFISCYVMSCLVLDSMFLKHLTAIDGSGMGISCDKFGRTMRRGGSTRGVNPPTSPRSMDTPVRLLFRPVHQGCTRR